MQETLIFTSNAANKVWELIREEGNFNLKLRAYVTGGGCSGFQYGFKFDDVINDDDTVVTHHVEDDVENEDKTGIKADVKNSIENDKADVKDDIDEGGSGESSVGHIVQLLVDPISYPYLAGAEIDYKEDLEGAQFIIRNPNAKTTCGCGSSFSL